MSKAVEAFFEELATLEGCTVNSKGAIRWPKEKNPGGSFCCPLEAVAFTKFGVRTFYDDAATKLGLSFKDRGDIVSAADNFSGNSFTAQEYRQRMLEVLGLTEVKKKA